MKKLPALGRVLIIDDETFDQKFYKRVLLRSGQVEDVISCFDAEQALAFLSAPDSPQIDLILLDIRMPRIDGFGFLQAARELLGPEKRVPVVFMLTTSLSPNDLARAEADPRVSGYLNKPLSDDHIAYLQGVLDDVRRAA